MCFVIIDSLVIMMFRHFVKHACLMKQFRKKRNLFGRRAVFRNEDNEYDVESIRKKNFCLSSKRKAFSLVLP